MSNKMKIFVDSRSFGAKSKEALDIIKQVAQIERSPKSMSEEELAETLTEYDGIIVGTGKITERVVQNSNRLKVVAKHGAGLDNIDLEACTRNGIVVTFLPGLNADSVADFTFCLMLALARKLIPAHISTKKGEWNSREFIGVEICGKTLGIVGFGNVGRKVAKRATGFDMNILCHTAHPDKHREAAEKYNIKFLDLETLLKESDFVSIHCGLTPQTEKMIAENELKLMKKSAFIINTARGAIIDEKALIKALKKGWIRGAAFDVFEEEPPKKSCPLFELENVIVVPHIASYTDDSFRKIDEKQALDVVKALRGEKPELVANPEVFKK